MEEQKKQRLIRDAVDLMGAANLADRMKVTVDMIAAWIDGSAFIDDKHLLTLSRVLLDWSGKQKF